MVVQHSDEGLRDRRERTRQAIASATEGHWEEAAEINRLIVASFPKDVEAHNRLGKAASELGRYSEARTAFSRTRELDPTNLIAKKNLARLQILSEDAPQVSPSTRVPPHFFMEQTGKTTLAALTDLPSNAVLAKSSAGEKVVFCITGSRLEAATESGQVLGKLDSRLSTRLIVLRRGGNEYEGAISSVSEGRLIIFIKETYQHPSQKGRLSFPPQSTGSLSTRGEELRYKPGDDTTVSADADTVEGPWGTDKQTLLDHRPHHTSRGFAALANGEVNEDE